MRARQAATVIAAAAWLSGCGACSPEKAPDDGNYQPPGTLTIAKVSFAGAVEFESVSVLKRTPPQPVDAAFYHRYSDGSWLEVDVLVPAGIFTGPGTYACGSEIGKTQTEWPYCTIKMVRSYAGGSTAVWWTFGYEVSPGVYGAVPACTVTVGSTSPRVSGTIDCTGLPYSSSTGSTPDDGKPASVVGPWEYLP